ncbi:S23 ribosomal protein [Leyella stercorea DSM 18206]|jgi:four helix bundle protein|uniref:S23 ribosomal protein n=1 Tax=Leyella stercorea DSM 18206 TaxID=1002367 RepID=G6B295_9BACT|nr:four helix bundle protein [Leyella stercorea]EHJ35067.1 S23 ribosomal protein [Leyella stercorea DSM 18206]
MGQTFQNILAWQKAYDFVLDVYKYTKSFPESEKYGLISQFQRAAVSIIANIAEGYKKIGKADKLRFMNISQGSLEECRCYVILSRDLGYIDNDVYNILYSKIEEASKLLNGYCKAMLNSNFSNTLE